MMLARRVELRRRAVVQPHAPARAREHHRPGAADQAGADDRCMIVRFHASHIHSTRRRSCEIVAQRRRRAVMDDAAALEHVRLVRQREDQVEIVLDDHDRQLLPQPVERLEQLLDHRRRQALERLVEQQHAHVPGRARARPRPSAARRPTGSRPACRAARASRGKNSRIFSSDHATPAPLAPLQAAELEIVAHAHAGEQPASLRHVADAAARDWPRRGAAPGRSPAQQDAPACARRRCR